MSRLLLDHDIDAILVGRRRPAAARRAQRDPRAGARSSRPWRSAGPRCRSSCPGRCRRPSTSSATCPSRPGPIVLAPGGRSTGGAGTRPGGPCRIRTPRHRGPGRRLGQARSPRRAAARGGHAVPTIRGEPSARRPRRWPTCCTRRVETIILGHDAGVRAAAEPSVGGVRPRGAPGGRPRAAAVAPDEPDDAIVDGVLAVVHRAVRPAPHPGPHA